MLLTEYFYCHQLEGHRYIYTEMPAQAYQAEAKVPIHFVVAQLSAKIAFLYNGEAR